MEIQLFQVDAFTPHVFRGNPAAVCPLEHWLPDPVLQAIASENNLSETAFFVPEDNGFRLRWFTPTTEVDLCGHATLASAFVVFKYLLPEAGEVRFETRSGRLAVRQAGARLVMDFPARPPVACMVPDRLLQGLGGTPRLVLRSRDYFVVYESEREIRDLQPVMEDLRDLDALGIIVTAPGEEVDFVSRFFAPGAGIPEDPVTGSAHCTLIPYWASRLGRCELSARQISQRGGELGCRLVGDRVEIAGEAVLYLHGTISLPDC
jgi:predicted PhzF superfamily epimerase YddE/YHI9